MPVPDNLTEDTLLDVVITVDIVGSKLSNLKTDKAVGDDGMAPRILKAPSEVILLLRELVEDVAVATSNRHADLSWARRFAVVLGTKMAQKARL